MDCKHCGRWAPDDPETGPDPCDLCADCEHERDEARSDDDWDRRMAERDDDPDGPWSGGFAPNH